MDVIRWSNSTEEFIRNALRPAEIERIVIDSGVNRATLLASPENKSLITRRQALCSRLVGLEIQVIDS